MEITQKVIGGIFTGVTTVELDTLAAETAASLTTKHPDYAILAARIAVSNLHKQTKKVFSEVMRDLHSYVNPRTGKPAPLLSDETWAVIERNKDRLDGHIIYERDFNFNYFGFKTLERAYLLKLDGQVAERPQHMFMRVAVGIHGDDIDRAIETYNHMSEGFFTHASPTLFNAGTPHAQLSSCFLLTMKDDSIEGIYDTLRLCAMISKSAGGIGLNVHNIRAAGSYIAGTNGESNGLVPMLRVYNNTARYVDQGGNKRPGAFAMYLEPWHADIFQFLDLKKNTGVEEQRARDLFYALWIPDLFMQRVEANGEWTLMCPHECPGLADCFGDEFEQLYLKYEREGRGRKTIKAQQLWFAIVESQIETGTPYMLYKDACNRKSNQQNLGTIKCSNLCTEIVEYSSPDEASKKKKKEEEEEKEKERENEEEEQTDGGFSSANLFLRLLSSFLSLLSLSLSHSLSLFFFFFFFSPRQVAVCNLASIALNQFVDVAQGTFNFQRLHDVTKIVTRNLNRIIDINYYPVPEARKSNMNHRPIGLGVQGLADAFCLLRLPFDSDAAKHLNKQIFETIYHAAVEMSVELAQEQGPYSTFEGSPASKGQLQYDMWGVTPTELWDWTSLKAKVKQHGMRNSLLLAPMPTASTAQILGNNESIEPFTSNIYSRRVLSGEFQVVNKHLLRDLVDLGIWNEDLKELLIAHNGSVQNIDIIPDHIKALYKTVWEISQRDLIDMAADRGAFIDQSQSFNVHIAEPSYQKVI